MTAIEQLEAEIRAFEAVTWVEAGAPSGRGESAQPGWVKFKLAKSELGWRTLEFLAWAFEDLVRAGRHLQFFPTSGPPYLGEPGACLAFAVECWMDGSDEGGTIEEVAMFLARCRVQHWDDCTP